MCKEEVDAGNRVDGYLSAEGYKNIELKFNARTQSGYVKKHFKNRWNSLKMEYARWLELISSAGLGWDPETGTFGADEDWWANHIQDNRWHAKFRNGPPDNLSLLEEIFGKAHVGESPPIPGEDLGQDKGEATRVNIDSSEEDAELIPSAMKKAKLSIPEEDLGEDREEATPVNIDGPDKDAELTPSAMKKARLAECKVSSLMVAVSAMKEDKNLLPQNYKKACNGTAEASSCDSNTVPAIREAVGLIRECGVSEGTALFYTATKVVALNPEYRELFALIRTKEGRLDWLQRAQDDTAMRVKRREA